MKRALFLLLTAAFVFPLSLAVDSLPGVKVAFLIDKGSWRNEFAPDVAWLESKGRDGMIGLLNQTFGFVNFRESGGSYELRISLKDRESSSPSSSRIKDVILEFSLSSPDIPTALTPVSETFRTAADCLLPRGEKDVFLNEILTSFEKYVRTNQEGIVERLLAKIRLADRAYQVENGHYWFLPLRCEDIAACNDPVFGSEFHIVAEIQTNFGNLPKDFYVRFCKATDPQSNAIPEDYWGEKIMAETYEPATLPSQPIGNQNIRVFMKKYIPGAASPPANKSTSPAQLAVTGK